VFAFALRNEVGAAIFAATSDMTVGPTGVFAAGGEAIARFEFQNWMVASTYTLTPSIARHGPGADAYDLRTDIAQLIVHGGFYTGGVTNLPHTFEVTQA
jgi:hypothetical protein